MACNHHSSGFTEIFTHPVEVGSALPFLIHIFVLYERVGGIIFTVFVVCFDVQFFTLNNSILHFPHVFVTFNSRSALRMGMLKPSRTFEV